MPLPQDYLVSFEFRPPLPTTTPIGTLCLLPQGKEYIFISNVDNLGATVDLDMLYHIFDQEAEFAVEAIERTRADLSGGLIGTYEGKPRVVELSTVPADRRDQIIKKLNLFNTNNM